VRMAAGLAAGTGSLGGAIWGAGAEDAEAGGEAIEQENVGENATQDENTPLLGTGRAGKPKKWKGGWSRQLNRASTRNYYKNWGSSSGRPTPLTKPGYTTTAAGDVVEEPTEQTPLTPKQQEIRNRVSGRPFRSYQYTYGGKTYHTTNEQLANVYNQGITTQRQPVSFGPEHRFGTIPEQPELPYYPYTLSQNHLNPALQMSHIRSNNKMLNKQGELVRPNYKWLKRLGLQEKDNAYVKNLKRDRNKKKAKVTTAQRPQVNAVVEDHNDYSRNVPKTPVKQPTQQIYTPQVRKMDIPADHKYFKELDEFKNICINVLSKSKYDPEKNAIIRGVLSEYLDGKSDALHMLRSAKKLMWLPPQQFLPGPFSALIGSKSGSSAATASTFASCAC